MQRNRHPSAERSAASYDVRLRTTGRLSTMRHPKTAAMTLAAVLALTGCQAGETEPPAATNTTDAGAPSPTESADARPSKSAKDAPASQAEVIGTVAENLQVPWGIDFFPNGDAIVTERDTARVLRIDAKTQRVTELGTIDDAAPGVEAGLLGVAVSPSYDEDSLIYLYLTTSEDNRVVRAPIDGGRLGTPEAILDGIPHGAIHDGGQLRFGPDGHLYVSTGETGEPELAPDPDSLGGKILRITADGDPAPGNPDPDSPVWSLGHRNVQGLAFDDDGRLWASEFGEQTWDELNLIEPGANYGWPQVEGTGGSGDLVDPVAVWRTSEASPSGLAWHDGSLWLAALRGRRLWQVPTDGAAISEPVDWFVGDYGRMRAVASAPDGTLWVTTSNHDGRGDPAPNDDRILIVETS